MQPTLTPVTSDGVTFLTDVTLLAETGIRVAFTQRHGGVSRAPYATLNLGAYVGDDPAHVAANRRRACRALGLEETACTRLNSAQQVHGTTVAHAVCEAHEFPATDALVTDQADLSLLLCFADCVPVIVVDPQVPAIGVIHSGWRGTLDEITAVTLDEMVRTLGAEPARMYAYIGPYIKEPNFAVSVEIAERFFARFDSTALPSPYNKSATERINLNLGACVSETLVKAGVRPCDIFESPIDTTTQTRDFFSYRAEAQVTGRFGALGCLHSSSSRS